MAGDVYLCYTYHMNRIKKPKNTALFIAVTAVSLFFLIGAGTAKSDVLDDAYSQLDQNPPPKPRGIQSIEAPTLITWVLGKRGCSIKNRYEATTCTTPGIWTPESKAGGSCNFTQLTESECKAKKPSYWTNGLPDKAYCKVISGWDGRTWPNQDTKSECKCDLTHWCTLGDKEEWVEAVPDYCDDRRWTNQSDCEKDGIWFEEWTVPAHCSYSEEKSQSACLATGTWLDETNSPDHCSDGTTKTLRECELAAQEQMRSLPQKAKFCITSKNDKGEDVRECRDTLDFSPTSRGASIIPKAYQSQSISNHYWKTQASKPQNDPGYCVDGSVRDSTTNSCVKDLNAKLIYNGDSQELPDNHKLVSFQIVGGTVENMFAPDMSNYYEGDPPSGDKCECDTDSMYANCVYSPYTKQSLECEGRSCSFRASMSSDITSTKSGDCYDQFKAWNFIPWPPSFSFEKRYYKVSRVPKFEIEPLNLNNPDPRYSDAEYARFICFGNQYKLPKRNGNTTTYWIDITNERRVYSSKITPSNKPNIACNIKIQNPFGDEVQRFDKPYAGTIYQSVNFVQLPEITQFKWDGAIASQEGANIKMFRNSFKTELSWKTIATDTVDIIERTTAGPKKLVEDGSPQGSITLDEMDYGIHAFSIIPTSKGVEWWGEQKVIVIHVIDPPLLAQVGAEKLRIAGKDGIRFTVFAQGATDVELHILTSKMYQLFNLFGTNKAQYKPERHAFAEPYYFYYNVTADQKDTSVWLDAWNTNKNNGQTQKEIKPIVSYHVDLSDAVDKCIARLRGAVIAKATASGGASAVAGLETGPGALLFGAFGLVYGGWRGWDDVVKSCNANPNYNPGIEFLINNLLPFDDKVTAGVKINSGGSISGISSGPGGSSAKSEDFSLKQDTSQLPKKIGDTMFDERPIGPPVISPDLWVDSNLPAPSLGQTSEEIKVPPDLVSVAEPADVKVSKVPVTEQQRIIENQIGIRQKYKHPDLIPNNHPLWTNNWKKATDQKLIDLSDYNINPNDIDPSPGRAWYEQIGLKGKDARDGKTEWTVMQGFNRISDRDGILYQRAQTYGDVVKIDGNKVVMAKGTVSRWFVVVRNKKSGEAVFIPIYDQVPY